jgi:large subunit ribosomal protein L29
MEVDAIRSLSTGEIRTKLDQSREEMRNLRFQRAVGQLTDLMRLRAVRRDIARFETILRERTIAAALEPATTEEE